MNRIFTREVQFDFEGNAVIEIPEEICIELDLQPNDILVYTHDEDKIVLRKRMEY